MKEQILNKVKEQLAKDYNCSIDDLNNKNTLITDIKVNEGARKYTNNKEILKLIVFNGKVIVSVDERIKEWCIEKFEGRNGDWLFLYSILKNIDNKLSEYGYEIDNTHHYYIPSGITEENIITESLRWYNQEEIKKFKGDYRFDEAFAFDERFPDVLAVGMVDNNENLLGMAGASKDGEIMWQIGINVMNGAEGNGIAKTLVSALKNEILRRGYIPFYGTIESHIISQKVALAAGFYPVFAELKIKKSL